MGIFKAKFMTDDSQREWSINSTPSLPAAEHTYRALQTEQIVGH